LKSRVAGSHMIYEANPATTAAPKIRQFIHKFVPDQLVLYGRRRPARSTTWAPGRANDRFKEAAEIPTASCW